MTHLAPGIAHVSFAGGGLFLVARDPAQRQSLLTEVANRCNAHDVVQVLFEKHRWLVRQSSNGGAHPCANCGHESRPACFDGANELTCYCLTCALIEAAGSQ